MDRFCVRAGIRHVVHQPNRSGLRQFAQRHSVPQHRWTGLEQGVNADVWVNGVRGWKSSLGVTWLRSELFESGAFSNAGGPWNLRWTTKMKVGRGCPLGLEHHGPNRRPHGHPILQRDLDRHQRSLCACSRFRQPFHRHTQGGRHTLTAGIQNVTDATQPSPLLGVDDPFGDNFEASRVYGPLEGRRVFVEWSWRLEGR